MGTEEYVAGDTRGNQCIEELRKCHEILNKWGIATQDNGKLLKLSERLALVPKRFSTLNEAN